MSFELTSYELALRKEGDNQRKKKEAIGPYIRKQKD